jgi:hypothetical protein
MGIVSGDYEGVLCRSCALEEQGDRFVLGETSDIVRVGRIGETERRNRVLAFLAKMEGSAAGDEEVQLPGNFQDGREIDRGTEYVLEVIEDQKEPLVNKCIAQCFENRFAYFLCHLERASNGSGNEGRIGQSGEIAEKDPIIEVLEKLPADLEGKSCLPCTSRASERHQTNMRIPQHLHHMEYLLLPADKWSRLVRQIGGMGNRTRLEGWQFSWQLPLACDLKDSHWIGQPFECHLSPVHKHESLRFPSKADHPLTGEDLAPTCNRAETSSEIERPTPVATSDWNGISGIHAYPHGEREGRIVLYGLSEPNLEGHGSTQSFASRREHAESLISAEFNDLPIVPRHGFITKSSKAIGKTSGGFIPLCKSKASVPPHIGDQEGEEGRWSARGRLLWLDSSHLLSPQTTSSYGSGMPEPWKSANHILFAERFCALLL